MTTRFAWLLVLSVGCSGTLKEEGPTGDDGDGGPVNVHDMAAGGGGACVPASPLKGGSFTAVEAIVKQTNTNPTPSAGCVSATCHGSPGLAMSYALKLTLSTTDDAANYTQLVNAGTHADTDGNAPVTNASGTSSSLIVTLTNTDGSHVGGTADSATLTTFTNWALDCFPGKP
jgi:hypothetical protein